jgi:hypothetical protein
MDNRHRRAVPLAFLSVVVVAAACGGAVENADLFEGGQQQGSSSGASGTSPTPTGSGTTSPTPSPPTPTPKPNQKCDVNFQDDVIGVFDNNGCSAIACHGGPRPLNPPRIDGADPTETYQAITAYRISGKPYVMVGGTDPKASAIYCNFRGDCGTRMPIGRDKLSSEDLQTIDEWLACGAPFN